MRSFRSFPLLLAASAASCASPDTLRPDPVPSAGAESLSDAVLDLGGAAAPLPAGPEEPRGLPPAGGDPAVAEVDGVPIRASEVARFLFRFDPARALESLNQILDQRILEADASALGVSIPPGVVEARTEEQVRARETEIRVQFGPETTLDRYLRDRYGFTVASFRMDTGALVRLQALRDRVVRYEASREDRIRIRVIVLPDEASAREATGKLRDGADFTTLARQVSLAPPEDLPPYTRAEIRPPELAEELFSLEAGAISRPVRVAEGGKELYEVFKVVERRPGREAPFAAAAEGIERELAERPVTPPEYLQWARRARERHGVKVLLEEPSGDRTGR